MNMKDWAKREIELACRQENPDTKRRNFPFRLFKKFDYGEACYESAFRAFKSLCKDGHSGFSIGLTKNILNRLIDGKPLTPIEDTDDIWYSDDIDVSNDGTVTYQCTRMPSLFKKVHPDGSVVYNDVERFVGVEASNPGICFSAGYIREYMDRVVGPVTMPYMPTSKPYYVYCEDFLVDPKNGDFDTVGLLYYKTPEGERKDLDIYLKGTEKGFKEITKEEYLRRKGNKYGSRETEF